MRFMKQNFLTLCCLALLIVMGMSGDAWALGSGSNGGSIMDTAQEKAYNVFKEVKTITFILGGLGLVGIAFQAIMGKVKWVWFAGLAVGLGILAAAGSIVQYATGDASVDIGSTFGNI